MRAEPRAAHEAELCYLRHDYPNWDGMCRALMTFAALHLNDFLQTVGVQIRCCVKKAMFAPTDHGLGRVGEEFLGAEDAKIEAKQA
jgi:hypothetical protein